MRIALLLLAANVYGATVNYKLKIANGTINPDGVVKSAILVNGQMPGPQINAMLGDLLVLDVTNNLNDGITIHLHGIDQVGTPFFDGNSMQLRVQMSSSGTFFYHAHHAIYDMTVFGALIIHDNRDVVENERVIILNDLWHADASSLLQGLLSVPFKWIGNAASILTNGASRFDACLDQNSTLSCSAPVPNYTVIEVEAGRTYRFRIINAATLGYFSYAIAGHSMTIIEVDGSPVQPLVVDHLEINTGQRYSVLITTDKTPQDYWMNTQDSGPINGHSLLRYASHSGYNIPLLDNSSLPILPKETPGWILSDLRQLKGAEFPAQTQADQIITLRNQQAINSKGAIRWSINNISFEQPNDQPILQYAYENKLSQLPLESRPISVKLNSIVDLILINTAALNGVCEEHPWHLHGHSFWVLGRGNGSYSPYQLSSLNLKDPVLRDTETLYPYIGASFQPKSVPGTECGWSYLRWKANNPGIWPFHCHIGSHVVLGMVVVFNVGNSTDLPLLPSDLQLSPPSAKSSASCTTGATLMPVIFSIVFSALI